LRKKADKIVFTVLLLVFPQVQVDASYLLTTNANLQIQTTNGYDLGYGLKTTGTLDVTGTLFPNIQPSGQFQVVNIATSGSMDIEFDFSTSSLVTRSVVSTNVSATFVSTGSLKVQLYQGNVASLACNLISANSSALVMNCTSWTISNPPPSSPIPSSSLFSHYSLLTV
jgi:hypothetical protein